MQNNRSYRQKLMIRLQKTDSAMGKVSFRISNTLRLNVLGDGSLLMPPQS